VRCLKSLDSSNRLVTLCLSRIVLPTGDEFQWGEVGEGLGKGARSCRCVPDDAADDWESSYHLIWLILTPYRVSPIILNEAALGVGLAQDNPDHSTQRVTGCLRKGTEANHYRLLDDNGKLWNLQSKNVSFAPHVGHHVGHLVSVTGTIPQKSANDNDKTGDTSPQNDLLVTKLDLVRDTCTP